MRQVINIPTSRILSSFLLSIFMYVFLISLSYAEYDEEEALIELYGDEETISIATGSVQPISRAPAVATVITAQDIKEVGATDIDDVLETVPGLHISRDRIGYGPIYTFRGIYSTENPQVLMLVNGIPITNLFRGDRNLVWGGFPVESISRIEVIRGSGSALFGADAFAGVINIITKQASEIDGFEFGSRLGSFDTQEAWALYGGKIGGFDVALTAEFRDTDGQDEDINADAATFQGTSLAPGAVNTGTENLDVRADINRGRFRFRTGLQRRRDFETGAGIASALDPNGTYESDRWNADLTYHDPEFTNAWDVKAQISYLNTSQEADEDTVLFPAGSFLPGPIGPYPDGIIGNPEVWEKHWRYNLTGLFSGFNNHLVRVGTGYNHSEVYKVKEERNFGFDSNGNFIVPGSPAVDVSDSPFVFLPEKHRNNSFAFIQDVWNFSNDWELTAGIRYDDYNDFGDTWNPRLALVWAARHDLTAKLLYSQAFRAPSFAEFRNQNNPVAIGNSELDPEEIETLELAFDYRPKDNLRLGLNLFRYQWDDIIRFSPIVENIGEQEGHGFEFEFDWLISRKLNLIGNYAYQDSEDKETNEDSGNAPMQQVYVRMDWEFLPSWHLAPQWNFVMDRKRVEGDSRSDIDDYDIFDLTLRSNMFSNRWELALSARNLFNKRAFEPSLNSVFGPAIPGDLPLARRSFWGELRFNY